MVNFVNTALLNVFLFFSVSFAWMCQIMFIGDIEEIHHLYCFTIYTLSDLAGKSSTFESTKVLYAMKQKVLGFEKQDCLHISFMLLL